MASATIFASGALSGISRIPRSTISGSSSLWGQGAVPKKEFVFVQDIGAQTIIPFHFIQEIEVAKVVTIIKRVSV